MPPIPIISKVSNEGISRRERPNTLANTGVTHTSFRCVREVSMKQSSLLASVVKQSVVLWASIFKLRRCRRGINLKLSRKLHNFHSSVSNWSRFNSVKLKRWCNLLERGTRQSIMLKPWKESILQDIFLQSPENRAFRWYSCGTLPSTPLNASVCNTVIPGSRSPSQSPLMTALWRSSLVWGFFVVDTVTTALQALEPKSFIHFSLYRYCVRASRPSKTFLLNRKEKLTETYQSLFHTYLHLESPLLTIFCSIWPLRVTSI